MSFKVRSSVRSKGMDDLDEEFGSDVDEDDLLEQELEDQYEEEEEEEREPMPNPRKKQVRIREPEPEPDTESDEEEEIAYDIEPKKQTRKKGGIWGRPLIPPAQNEKKEKEQIKPEIKEEWKEFVEFVKKKHGNINEQQSERLKNLAQDQPESLKKFQKSKEILQRLANMKWKNRDSLTMDDYLAWYAYEKGKIKLPDGALTLLEEPIKRAQQPSSNGKPTSRRMIELASVAAVVAGSIYLML